MSVKRRTSSVVCRICGQHRTRHISGHCPDCRTDDPPTVTAVRHYVEIVHRGGTIRLHPDAAVALADELVDHAEALGS